MWYVKLNLISIEIGFLLLHLKLQMLGFGQVHLYYPSSFQYFLQKTNLVQIEIAEKQVREILFF